MYKLTHYTHGLGCACKLRPQALEEVLAGLPMRVLVQFLCGVSDKAGEADISFIGGHTVADTEPIQREAAAPV
jgi:selenophosphate synthase